MAHQCSWKVGGAFAHGPSGGDLKRGASASTECAPAGSHLNNHRKVAI